MVQGRSLLGATDAGAWATRRLLSTRGTLAEYDQVNVKTQDAMAIHARQEIRPAPRGTGLGQG
jgi:hypothetical protein